MRISYKLSINDIANQIPFGKFQYEICAAIFIFYISTAFLSQNHAYFLKQSFYLCENNEGVYKECERDEICGNPSMKWMIDYNNYESVHNWV